jgi:putative transposase
MKKKRFSVEQIVAVVKQAELGLPVADLIRQVGISEQTFYRWKKKYAGLEPDQARELKQLADENARLKKTGGRAEPRQGCATGRAHKKPPASAHKRRCGVRDGVSRLQRAAGLCADTPGALDPAQAECARPSARRCGCGCMKSRRRASAMAIGGCTLCSSARARAAAATWSIACTAKKT